LWIKKCDRIQADYVTDDSKKLAEKYCIASKRKNFFYENGRKISQIGPEGPMLSILLVIYIAVCILGSVKNR
jgi:hypothetical protein